MACKLYYEDVLVIYPGIYELAYAHHEYTRLGYTTWSDQLVWFCRDLKRANDLAHAIMSSVRVSLD